MTPRQEDHVLIVLDECVGLPRGLWEAAESMRQRKLCCARSRRLPPCQMFAMDNGLCRIHGGKNNDGIASGS